MRQKLNDTYRKAAEEFARRVTSALEDKIDSIVLYGSAARGEATRDSDIDVLVISPDPKVTRERISRIRGDFTYERNFDFLISLFQVGRDQFYEFRDLGSPFVEELSDAGVILYDNGTFSLEARAVPSGVEI